MQKTIIITGANGNLGTAVVKKFLQEKYTVIGVDSAANNLQFARNNPSFEVHSVNLMDENLAVSFINNTIDKHKKIENALMLVGGFAMGKIGDTSGADMKKMYALNFETAFYTARPLFTHMVQNNYGRLVFVGARPAITPKDGKSMVAYALSKSLLFRLTEILNEEAKGKNVVASVIVPSTIDTPANRESMPAADPAKWVRPEQIADVLEFICSERGDPVREGVYKIYNES